MIADGGLPHSRPEYNNLVIIYPFVLEEPINKQERVVK